MLIASVVALGTSGYLAWSPFTASPVACCDGGSVFNFDDFHNYLFDAQPGYAQAMAKAKATVDGDKLDQHLRSTLPADFIKQHITLYQKAGAGTIPKFLFPKATTVGAIESSDAMTRLINQHLSS